MRKKMIRSKRRKILRYTHDLYVKKAFPFVHTTNIDDAKNYYPFHNIVRTLIYWKYKLRVKPLNALSVEAKFDSKMEVETGGIKGLWQKILLKIIRYLEEKRNS